MPDRHHPLFGQVREALQAGRFMEAIRLLRRVHELEQAEAAAKEPSDHYPGVTSPGLEGLSPGEVPRTSSNVWLVVVVALAVFLLVYLMR